MSVTRIAPIVEGHGDERALPVLLRRMLAALTPPRAFEVLRPKRISRDKLLRRDGELERAIELCARQTVSGDAILVVIDADDDCPAEVGAALLARAQRSRPDRTFRVVLAKREFEAWFIGAATSIAGLRGLDSTLVTPNDPEAIRDAKGWLTRHMPEGQRYSETLDQAALAASIDLRAARAVPSFSKLWRDVTSL